MSNWDILVKVCDKMRRKELRTNKDIRYEYMFRDDVSKYTSYLCDILEYNSRDYNRRSKIIYWIKE